MHAYRGLQQYSNVTCTDTLLCIDLLTHNGMACVEITASQARTIYQCKNVRMKVLKCCADIFFN